MLEKLIARFEIAFRTRAGSTTIRHVTLLEADLLIIPSLCFFFIKDYFYLRPHWTDKLAVEPDLKCQSLFTLILFARETEPKKTPRA